jgi:hypothetical protein
MVGMKLPTSALPLQRIETIDEPHDRKKAASRKAGFVRSRRV